MEKEVIKRILWVMAGIFCLWVFNVTLNYNKAKAWNNVYISPAPRTICNPTASPSATVAPTPIPSPLPTIISVPTERPEVIQSPPIPNNPEVKSPSVCVGSGIKFIPTIISIKRVDADSIYLKWTPVDSFIHDYVINYSLGPNFPMWSTTVKNSQETVINDLPRYLPIWASVAGTDNCTVGKFSIEIDP